ncbi:UpxY family transcription antiterminator [Phocaeicola oris]|uniref:UpxY family transcription antiterminator n=1 Tax=Phocaeicola oris TaxID=2896850 RepID=UPI00234EAB20|nr:UpxY family transcription antiterminator [Phocaeicola oris]MCE2615860.1 UpxY family transcription antiterminator [Phocaeicola oris]
MIDEHKRYWYVAYTLSRHEKKVAEKLKLMGIDCYLPIQEEIQQYQNRKKKIQRVVLPMTIFIHGTSKERLEALQLPSITHYLMEIGKHKAATVPDDQMERFRFMLDYSDATVEIENASLQPGMQVRVIKGPLTGLEGELININKTSKVIVRIDLLGAISTEIPISFVESIHNI